MIRFALALDIGADAAKARSVMDNAGQWFSDCKSGQPISVPVL